MGRDSFDFYCKCVTIFSQSVLNLILCAFSAEYVRHKEEEYHGSLLCVLIQRAILAWSHYILTVFIVFEIETILFGYYYFLSFAFSLSPSLRFERTEHTIKRYKKKPFEAICYNLAVIITRK